jgi:hypothetical protein
LIDIRRMAGIRDHDLDCTWDLCGHVVRSRKERRVVGADDDERGTRMSRKDLITRSLRCVSMPRAARTKTLPSGVCSSPSPG